MEPPGRGAALKAPFARFLRLGLVLALTWRVAPASGTELPPEAAALLERSDEGVRVAMELGRYAQAADLAASALEARSTFLGPNHPDVAISLTDLGRAETARGKPMLAVPALEQALMLREIHLGTDDPLTADTLVALGDALLQIGQLGRAASCLRSALEIRTGHVGPEHPSVAEVTFLLAQVVRARGDLAEADDLYASALAIWKAAGDTDAVAHVWEALAELALERGEPNLARERYEAALAVRGEGLGPDDPRLAELRVGFGRALAALGDLGRSEAELRGALASLEGALGAGHPRTADALVALAATLRRQGDLDGALQCALGAAAIQEAALPVGDPATAPTFDEVARIQRARGEFLEAKLAWLGALRATHSDTGIEHPLSAPILRDIGATLRIQGAFGDASSAVEASLDALQGPGGRASAQLARTLLERSRVLRQLGDVSMAQRSVEGARVAAIGEGRPDVALLIDISAEDAAARLAAGDQDGAARRFDQALAEAPSVRGPLPLNVVVAHARALDARLVAFDAADRAAEGLAALLVWRDQVVPRALGGSGREIALDDVCDALRGGAVLVDLHLVGPTGAGPLVAHVLTAGNAGGGACRVARFTLDGAEARDAAAAWREALADESADPARVQAAGARVHAAVWAPLTDALAGAARVYLVTDGILSAVPFAALPTAEGPLVTTVHVGSLASPGQLVRVRARRGRGVAAFGTSSVRPALSSAAEADSGGTTSSPSSSRAPTGPEGWTDTRAVLCRDAASDAVGELPDGVPVLPASERALVAAASDLEAFWLDGPVHLGAARCRSGLSTWDDETGGPPGLLTGVVLGPEVGGSDGVLVGEEIARLRLEGVRLVVLSGRPADVAPERAGVVDLAWGATGVGALARTLWADADGDALSAVFGTPRARKRPDRALRRWQLDAIEGAPEAHPGAWAGVVVRGSTR